MAQNKHRKNKCSEHVMILIDTNPEMFIPCVSTRNWLDIMNKKSLDELITPFDVAHMVCEKLLYSQMRHVAMIRTRKRNSVGVWIYGERIGSTPFKMNMTDELLKISPPGIHEIQEIRSCIHWRRFDLNSKRIRDLQSEIINDNIPAIMMDSGDTLNYTRDNILISPLEMALYAVNKSFMTGKYENYLFFYHSG